MTKRQSESNLAIDYSSDPDSFEKTYKNSYSHGLEKIYALQNVDFTTVRKIDLAPAASKTEKKNKFSAKHVDEELEQLELNFQDDSDRLEPFILREPIQVLGLSQRTEALLLAQHKYLIKDLLAEDRHTLVSITGIGFGHLDELQNRLQEHLKGHSVDKVRCIDFTSWARTLIGDISAKKMSVALEPYGLSHLIHLSTAESVEIRRATGQTRHVWAEEVLAQLRSPERLALFFEDLRRCVRNFIVPWMECRHGLATVTELNEYFPMIGTSNSEASTVLKWMKEVFCQGNPLISQHLRAIDANLYSCSERASSNAILVINTAKSYFYRSDLHYTLQSLVDWITNECAKAWIGFTEGFIEKVLRLSSHFRVRRGACGNLIVKLNCYL